jgi:hypothetical protein
MFKKRLISLIALAGLVCAFAGLSVGQASAATLQKTVGETKTAFLAIYGNPPATVPVGGGIGRNFGFGENMLFVASTTNKPGTNISIELGTLKAESADAFLGGTLMSNKTGKNTALGFSIQFVDLQDNTPVAAFTDTADRPWIADICPELATTKECKVDPRGTEAALGAPESSVKIENVSFDLGPGTVVQGTAWGKWENGAKEKPPCITLNLPPEKVKEETLYETQGESVGTAIKAISGKACLTSSNNDWYAVGTAKEEPAITIANE